MTTRPGSILAADFGSTKTRAILYDVVAGEYRMVARGESATTMGYPTDDASLGLQRILQRMVELSGRSLLDERNQLITPETGDRSGVDMVLTTTSAGQPMRVVLVGLMPDISLETARRAMAGTYTQLLESVHLNDGRSEEERLNAILLSRPDLIIIVGGTEGGARQPLQELLDAVQLALQLADSASRPHVLYAGNSSLAAQVHSRFGELTTVFIANNVRPSLDEESFDSVRNQLGHAYDEYKDRRGGAFGRVVSSSGLLPSAQSWSLVTSYFAATLQKPVISVDMGSANSVIAYADGDFRDMRINTPFGLGHGAQQLLAALDIATLRSWIPFAISSTDIQNYAYNKALRPASLPLTLDELYIEHALLRAGLRHMLQEARIGWPLSAQAHLSPGLIIAGGGGLTGMGSAAYNMLLVADVVQPKGICDVKLDPLSAVAGLGVVARQEPDAATQLLDGNVLEHAGTIVSVSGQPEWDKPVLKLKITTEDGEVFDHSVDGGHVFALPLPTGLSLSIEMQLPRGLSIGGKRRLSVVLKGGTGGLLFDVRGRPLAMPADLARRAERMPLWVHEATGDPLQSIAEDMLEEIVDAPLPELSQPASSKKAPRRGFRLFGRGGKPKAAASSPVEDVDEDFLALLDDDEPRTDPPERKGKGKGDARDEDMDSLRELF